MPQQRIFAVNGIPEDFFLSSESTLSLSGNHTQGLNSLAEHALERANDWDWLLILDSDAFPIVPLSQILNDVHPSIAVQRLENLGDIQPHPSFCAAKAGLWRELQPDWGRGYRKTNSSGMSVTDVGGGVLEALDESGTSWQPLVRSTTRSDLAFADSLKGPAWSTTTGLALGLEVAGLSGSVKTHESESPGVGNAGFFIKVGTQARRGDIAISLRKLSRRRGLFIEAFEKAIDENPNSWKAVT